VTGLAKGLSFSETSLQDGSFLQVGETKSDKQVLFWINQQIYTTTYQIFHSSVPAESVKLVSLF